MNTQKVIPLWFLAMLTLTGTVAMHLFIPVLPLIAEDLHANLSQVQLTLSAYIIGLAVGQLFYGPLADTIGRRPVLIVGMLIYALSSFGAMFAEHLGLLIGFRFLQALGGCSGLLLGRTIVRDTTQGNETTKKLSLMNMMVILGPGLSPIIGGLLASLSGWRSLFFVLSMVGLLNLFLIWLYISDQNLQRATTAKKVLEHYRKLIRSPKFIGYTISGGLATTSIYAFLSVASFIVIHQLHGSLHQVSVYLALTMVGMWFGSFASNRLIDRFSLDNLLRLGSGISLLSSLVLFGCIFLGYLNSYTLVIPIIIYCFGAGISSPAALTKALNSNPVVAGSASGIYGFFQMLIGAICTLLSGLGTNPAFSAACVLLGACLIVQICLKVARSV